MSRRRYDPDRHHRRSIRLPGYDYAMPGAYFVTLCASGRECLFGEIERGEMRLNDLGLIVRKTWEWLEERFPTTVTLDDSVVMPNHLHGILWLTAEARGSRPLKLSRRKPLGRLVGAFKTTSTKRVNALRRSPGTLLWQRNYFDRVIRSDSELRKVREYIRANPLRWTVDEENPQAIASVATGDRLSPAPEKTRP